MCWMWAVGSVQNSLRTFQLQHPQVNYIGLDPIDTNPDRDYLFLNALLEDVDQLLEPNSIDIFCFSTSLDHIEDLSAIPAQLKGVARENAKMVMIQSVRDTQVLANHRMYYHLNLMNSGTLLGTMTYLKAFNRFRIFFREAMRIRKKVGTIQRKMPEGKPLDQLHFHYFTVETLTKFLKEQIGPSEVEQLILPYYVLLTVNEIEQK